VHKERGRWERNAVGKKLGPCESSEGGKGGKVMRTTGPDRFGQQGRETGTNRASKTSPGTGKGHSRGFLTTQGENSKEGK